MSRWLDDWASGVNRFDRPGELCLSAWAGSALVGVGGLNRDPFTAADDVGRVRHLYVLRAAGRRGVATLLLSRLVASAGRSFVRLRLRAGTDAAGAFYVACGFTPTDEEDATHALALPAPGARRSAR